MTWFLLLGVTLTLGLSYLVAASRRAELARMESTLRERDRAVAAGDERERLRHPVIDLTRCLGCATCVSACPEDGVLELVHGQALVVRGARCQGIAACARECPVGAITVTLADLRERTDVPVVAESCEAADVPGLFLAGEVTAHALIRTAIEHGTAVAAEVSRRVVDLPTDSDALDLVIVGAGPAGLACALEAQRRGLAFVVLEAERAIGGTVAKYPRRKLVVTRPIELPLVGRLKRTEWSKEELIELWEDVVREHAPPLMLGVRLEGLERGPDGAFTVHTRPGDGPASASDDLALRARHVCLALGRRGTPNRLGVPGEDLPKVATSLLDAASYTGRRVLVVGGGDSAVEAALALAEQPRNRVTLSYRRPELFRITAANHGRLARALEAGRVETLMPSTVLRVTPDAVDLEAGGATVTLPNDEVFVLAGGTPPTGLLRAAGVSFDHARRPGPRAALEQGTGLQRALAIGLGVSLVALAWAFWHRDYYALALEERPVHDRHRFLRPGEGAGLWLGITATVLIAANLVYLLRRSPRVAWFRLGSLERWMTSHVATGVLAFLCAALHAAMAPGDSAGGHAFWALAVLMVTGGVGRYFYSYVPREANGRELELDGVQRRLVRLADEWDQGQKRFRATARDLVARLVDEERWSSSFLGRVRAMITGRRRLRQLLRDLRAMGRADGLAELQIEETLRLARRAHAAAVAAAHYEDLRAVAGAWRYLHRWVALLMVVLLAVHVGYALLYGGGGR
jgi:thioredoxin reductase